MVSKWWCWTIRTCYPLQVIASVLFNSFPHLCLYNKHENRFLYPSPMWNILIDMVLCPAIVSLIIIINNMRFLLLFFSYPFYKVNFSHCFINVEIHIIWNKLFWISLKPDFTIAILIFHYENNFSCFSKGYNVITRLVSFLSMSSLSLCPSAST